MSPFLENERKRETCNDDDNDTKGERDDAIDLGKEKSGTTGKTRSRSFSKESERHSEAEGFR